MATKFEDFVSDNKVSEKPTKKERQVAEKQNKSVAEVREEASSQSSKVTVTSSSSSGSRSSSSGSCSARSIPKKPEQKKSQFEEYVGGSTPEETKKASRQQQKSQQKQKQRMGPPKPTQYQRYQQRQTVNTGNINQGQRTSSTRFQDTQKQFRTDTLQPEIAPQEKLNRRNATPNFGPKDRQRLQDISDRGVRVSDFDEITETTGRGRASYNIETGGGQGTVSKRQQENIDVIQGVEAKKTSKAAGTTLKTAGIGAAAGVAGPVLPGVVKVAGLGIGALSLSKEIDTIASIRKERPEEAGFRTSNIFAGLFGAGVGVASQRSVYTNLKKFNEFSIGKIEKLDQVRIFPDKLGKIGGKSAKFRSGKISKGQLRKGKDFRQLQKQQENIKDIFKQPGTRKVRIDERNILNIQKTGKTDVVSSLEKIRLGQPISPIVTKQKQFLVTTKGKRGTPALQSLFTKKGVTSGLAKTKSSGKLGAAGQSQRPNRLFTPKSENFIAFKSKTQSSGLVSQQITQTKPQSFKILGKIKTPKPQTTPQATIFKPAPKTSNVKFKPLETTKTSSVAPQQTQQINRGFRQGQRQKIISRLQEKKQTQDFTKTSQQLPKTSSDLQLVKPKTTKTEFKKATRIKKEDKAFTFLSLPQDTRQEQDLGTRRFSGLDLSKQPEISFKSKYDFRQKGFVGPLQQEKPEKQIEQLEPKPVEIERKPQKRKTRTILRDDTTKTFKQETFIDKPIQTSNTPFRTSRPLLRNQQPL